MNRFAGKFAFSFNRYKLIFFDYRVGFVHETKRTFTLNKKTKSERTVPLPDDAALFIAYERMDGWAVLQAFNGEFLAFGGESAEEIIPTTLPTINPRYPVRTYLAYFDLSTLRAARTDVTQHAKIAFKRPDASYKGVSYLRPRYDNPHDMDDFEVSQGITNLTSSAEQEPALLRVAWYADGVHEMTSGTKTVERFDFRPAGNAHVDLSGEDLSGVTFGISRMHGVVMKGTKLANAKFDGADLSEATLDDANFTGATLNNVDFTRASMARTILTGVTGKSCDFSDCDLRTVVSTNALALQSPEAEPLRFSNAKLKYALLGTDWKYRRLDYAQVESFPDLVTGLDAQHSVLTGMELGSLNATGAKFNNATMHAVGLSNAKLIGAKFDSARLESVSLPDGSALAAADLTAADLRGASFSGTNASAVSFSGARLTEAKFDGATLRGANFANAFMKLVDFSGVEQKMMHGANFSRAFLVGCKFIGADLSVDVQLVQAYLHGADFSNAQLSGANLSGAGIPEDEGELSVTVDGVTTDVPYTATVISPSVSTSSTTRCPNGDLGPCVDDKMVPRRPFPTSWPWPMGLGWPHEDDRASDA